MATNATETSSLTSTADLTEIHAQSGLPFPHNSRRTKTGFLVTGEGLVGYSPTPPSKWPKRKWFWDYGEAVSRNSDGACFHLCRICYDNPSKTTVTLTASHTTLIRRHLYTHGFDKQGNKVEKAQKKRRNSQEDVRESMKRQREAQETVFDLNDWQATFVAWAVQDDVSLNKTTSAPLQKLLLYRNPIIKGALPSSYNTTRSWILKAAQQAKVAVRRSLASSKSRITLSFDGWKSDNQLDLLGVVAHYIDDQYRGKNVLIALRNTYGSHTGAEIAYQLLAVTREYKISSKVAYFMADNASNNDTALQLLESDLNIQANKSRLRCVGHIINLVTKSILYGTDIDCIEETIDHATSKKDTNFYTDSVSRFEAILRSKDDVAILQAWRKKGPVGKLHNIVLHARDNPSRRAFFQSKQREAGVDCKRLYELVVNGGIRWNSTCDMIERAFKLKDAIELYQHAFKDDNTAPLANDLLTSDDWLELKDILNLLLPLKIASKNVQSDGKDCKHGSLFESLQAIDWLLDKLEKLKNEHQHLGNSHFKACINLGWKKLNKYYTLSDETAAYRAAIAIHPHFKTRWFKKQWHEHHPQWVEEAERQITELFKDYKRRHGDEVQMAATAARPSKELSEFEAYNALEDDAFEGDDLQRYLSEAPAPKDTNPVTWWRLNQHRYPVLRHMAFDLLAAPASSSADERQFSKAGHVLDDEHFNTKDDLAESQQLVKSALDEGINICFGERDFLILLCARLYSLTRRLSGYRRDTSTVSID
jgi:hypothetical protein